MADGRMTACGCLDNNGSLAIGNIRDNTIVEMRLGERYQRMIEGVLVGQPQRISDLQALRCALWGQQRAARLNIGNEQR